MPVQTCLLMVEGPHDTEFLAALLRELRFHRIPTWEDLPEYWRDIVPRSFPVGNDLLARHPVPTFFRNGLSQTVAIRSASGIGRLTTSLSDTLSRLAEVPHAVGLVLDADQALAPADRHRTLLAEWEPQPSRRLVHFPPALGQVAGAPQAGVFILPDNVAAGTLEDLLLQCASVSYPHTLAAAQAYLASPKPDLLSADLLELEKPAGWKKAVIAAIGSILKPGKAIQTSIQDNRWLTPATLQLPDIARVLQFLQALLS